MDSPISGEVSLHQDNAMRVMASWYINLIYLKSTGRIKSESTLPRLPWAERRSLEPREVSLKARSEDLFTGPS